MIVDKSHDTLILTDMEKRQFLPWSTTQKYRGSFRNCNNQHMDHHRVSVYICMYTRSHIYTQRIFARTCVTVSKHAEKKDQWKQNSNFMNLISHLNTAKKVLIR